MVGIDFERWFPINHGLNFKYPFSRFDLPIL